MKKISTKVSAFVVPALLAAAFTAVTPTVTYAGSNEPYEMVNDLWKDIPPAERDAYLKDLNIIRERDRDMARLLEARAKGIKAPLDPQYVLELQRSRESLLEARKFIESLSKSELQDLERAGRETPGIPVVSNKRAAVQAHLKDLNRMIFKTNAILTGELPVIKRDQNPDLVKLWLNQEGSSFRKIIRYASTLGETSKTKGAMASMASHYGQFAAVNGFVKYRSLVAGILLAAGISKAANASEAKELTGAAAPPSTVTEATEGDFKSRGTAN